MLKDQTQNFTDQELKFSYWYITHKLLLRRIFIIFLIATGFLIWFFVIWQLAFWGAYFQLEQYQIKKLIFNDNPGLTAIDSARPRPLQISDPLALAGENDRRDYLAEVTNGNDSWLAVFDYTFDSGGSQTRSKQGFILPTEKKFLVSLGAEGNVSTLKISNVSWQRLVKAQAVYEDRYRFKIENDKFLASQQAGEPSQLVFDITNSSPFSYWQVGVQMFLYSGGNIVSADYLVLEQLKSGEKRLVAFNWSGKLPRLSKIEIIPEVNVFDESNIMPQTVEPQASQ